MINVSVSYVNPSPLDSCEQYTAKAMFGLRQAYGTDNVVVVNGTAGRLVGPINIPVIVTDVRNNRTGALAFSASRPTGYKYAVIAPCLQDACCPMYRTPA
jgi:hypothetical protein